MSQAAFTLILAGSTAIDAIVAMSALLARRRSPAGGPARPIGVGRLARAVAITGLVFLLKLGPLAMAGVNAFGVIHLIYIDLVVLLPAAGLVLLLGSWLAAKGGRWPPLSAPARAIALAAQALIPIGVDATWIEPFRLQLETARLAVPARRDGAGVVRIGVLSDLQTARVTDYERGAVARLMAQRPDLILMPGDVFQGVPEPFEANREALHDLLARLAAPGGVYLVLGDVDGAGEHFEPVLRGTNVRLLVDESVRVDIGDRRVTIAGIELDPEAPRARDAVDRLEAVPGEGDLRILLAHRPDVALGLRTGSRIDLVVSGHTHGGQVVVPGFGPPITLSHVPREVAAGGLHRIAGNAVYVSRGVGCERGQAPRIRFLCPPEITLIELPDGAEPRP